MKKKILVIMTAVIMAFVCAFAFVACGSGDDVEGTYYVYMNGEKQDGMTMKLDDGKMTMTQTMEGQSVTVSGTYKVDGKNVKVTASVMGVSSTETLTIVSDGVLKDSEGLYYCKDGKTPPADEETEE